MMAATFTGTGRGKAGPEEQFRDALGEDTEDSIEFPKVLEDAEQPKEGKPGTSKSKGKQLGDQPAQAAEGAEAPPEETPPDPNPTKPHTDPAPDRSTARHKQGSHPGSHQRSHPGSHRRSHPDRHQKP